MTSNQNKPPVLPVKIEFESFPSISIRRNKSVVKPDCIKKLNFINKKLYLLGLSKIPYGKCKLLDFLTAVHVTT